MQRDLILHGLASTGWVLLCAVVVAAAAALIVLLLRYERRLVPRRVGWTLLTLRLSVLGLLFVAFLEPVLTWTLDHKRTGRIVVAVDLSESMDTADPHASQAEKLRWARALGMIGNPAIDERLDRWISALEAGEEPEWADASDTPDPERRRQLAETRRENLDGIFAEIDRLPRKEIVRRLLSATASPLLPKLEELGQVELVVFAGKVQSADAESLEKLLAAPPDGLLAGTTDLAGVLAAAAADQEHSPLMGVVLFTDGRDNAGRDAIGAAARLGALSAPVCPVMLGSELRPKDLAIASLDYPQTAFKDDTPLLRATLSTAGFEGEEIEVVLAREGADPVTRTVTPAGPSASVEFPLSADEIGRQEYVVRTEVRPGETRDDNNEKPFAMSVIDDKVRVLLLDGEARWEFRFLDNALSRDERVEVQKVVFRQPYVGALDEPFFPRRLPLPADADDLQAAPFAGADLVIVGDVSPGDLSPVGWELLEKFVAESGGTLVLVAGKQFLPLAFNSPIIDRLVPLTNLRPVNITGPTELGPPTERGFRLRLTPEGESEAMLQFDADPAENRRIWSGLPGHSWGVLGEAKPGATVLSWARRPDARPDLDAERRNAVIVRQPYGFGQVLWVGIDSTWRWRHRVGDKYHHRFWGQLGRWAADNKTAAGNEHVRFGPDRSDLEVGEDAVIRARWTQPFLRRFPQVKAKAELYRGEQLFTTVDLKPDETRPLMHEARVVALPPGEYRVRLIVEGGDLGPDEVSAPLYVREQQTLELSDLSAHRNLLSQLADAGGGRLFLPDQLDELPGLFRDPDLHLSERREISLWDHWLVMLLFFGLLTAEWVTRKLNGLP